MESGVAVRTPILSHEREKKKKLTLEFDSRLDHKTAAAGKGEEAALEDRGLGWL